MKSANLGIWVDHRQAFLVRIDGEGRTLVQHMEAEPAERGLKASRAGGMHGALAPHVHLEEKRRHRAEDLYKRMFKAVREAEQVYIFGPGLAKKELERTLAEHKEFSGRVVAVESAEKMDQWRMAARTREFFGVAESAA